MTGARARAGPENEGGPEGAGPQVEKQEKAASAARTHSTTPAPPSAAKMSCDSPAVRFLCRLEGVRETGAYQWTARCPAHEDHNPSLSIRETTDGTVLVHCFAQCSPSDVLAAVGLELRDLFPRPLGHHRAPIRARDRWDARALLRLLRRETSVVSIAANHVAAGQPMSDDDLARLRQAIARVAQIVEVMGDDL